MKTYLRSMVVVGVVVYGFAAAPLTLAQSCPESAPFSHLLGGFLTGLPEGAVTGRGSEVGNSAAWTGTSQFLCTSVDTPGIDFCTPEAGTPNDGRVVIDGNWANPGIAGCPVDASTTPDGDSPIVVLVTSSAGEGAAGHSGKYAILSVGWSNVLLSYPMDFAHPDFDPVAGAADALGSAEIPAPLIFSIDNNGNGTANVGLGWNRAVTHDDCLVNPLNTCTDFPGSARPGLVDGYNVYGITGPCANPPTTGMSGAWGSPIAMFPGIGTLEGSVTVPFDATGTTCTYLALGLQVGGAASGAVSAHATITTVPPNDCSTPGQQDSDGDGIPDVCDNCPFVANRGQEDTDGDGDGDACDNCPAVPNPSQANADGDPFGDACDPCPNVADNGVDSDSDGIGDACDNCAGIFNPNQADADADNVGDLCDNCPNVANTNQVDTDLDTFGDVCDNCPDISNAGQLDADGDGDGDVCDVCPTIPNPDQNPDPCYQAVLDANIDIHSPAGRGSGLVTWRTSTEIDLVGFNVVRYVKGQRIQLNHATIACSACSDGRSGSYSFIVPKHKSGQNLFVEMVRVGGLVESIPVSR